ncbi:MAG: hypothetical protein M1837_004040 [Sclerophora amabilis]|nr:MAG: hypothetical protein M1837_004040 [Sclerophora amabilis]
MFTKTFTTAALAALCVDSAFAKMKYGGINIAGLEFGCDINGTCIKTTTGEDNKGALLPENAGEQMEHFVADKGLNAFRLPVGWQYLVKHKLGGDIDDERFEVFDSLVKDCTTRAELCILDIHNYGRYENKIIGQSGDGEDSPTDEKFAKFWSDLAGRYKDVDNVAFGVMNEPHDMPDLDVWVNTTAKVVEAIRGAGAKSQYILLPGDVWTSAGAFVSSGSAKALGTIKDEDGTTDKLIFDVHKYFDADNSGTSTTCVGSQIEDVFQPLAEYLQKAGRKAFLSEFGAGNTQSCVDAVCGTLAFMNENDDAYLGYTSWAAGGFDETYELVETPIKKNGKWKDQLLVEKCIAPAFNGEPMGTKGGNGTISAPSNSTTSSNGTTSDPEAPYPTGGAASSGVAAPSGAAGSSAAAGAGSTPASTGAASESTDEAAYPPAGDSDSSVAAGAGSTPASTGAASTGAASTGAAGAGSTVASTGAAAESTGAAAYPPPGDYSTSAPSGTAPGSSVAAGDVPYPTSDAGSSAAAPASTGGAPCPGAAGPQGTGGSTPDPIHNGGKGDPDPKHVYDGSDPDPIHNGGKGDPDPKHTYPPSLKEKLRRRGPFWA